MVKDLCYTVVARVIESWDQARVTPNFEESAGELALLKLFELEPRTKKVFNFAPDYVPSPEELKSSGNLTHAVRMMEMFDAALSMLGPDSEALTEILHDLGKRHIRYGVSPHFFPFMGQALIYALSQILGSRWNSDVENAWVEVYDELSGDIMKSILNE